MPLSEPSGGSVAGLQISQLVNAALMNNVGSSNTGVQWQGMNYRADLDEVIIGGEANIIASMIGIGTGKANNFPTLPDAGNGFPAGAIATPFRSDTNFGAGANGSIFCTVDADVNARSDDDGATWVNTGNPHGGISRGLAGMQGGRLWSFYEDAGAGNCFFSDDGGATYTAATDLLGTGHRNPIVNLDGTRVLSVQNGLPTFSFTQEISGVPSFTLIDLNAETGQTSGPGGSARGTSFDSFGGCLLVGDFGDMCYTPDFLTFQLIPDDENPLYRGDNVASTTQVASVWSELHQGFIAFGSASGNVFGSACFYPLSGGVIGTPVAIPYIDTLSGNADDGVADANGNILFVVAADDNTSVVSLIEKGV